MRKLKIALGILLLALFVVSCGKDEYKGPSIDLSIANIDSYNKEPGNLVVRACWMNIDPVKVTNIPTVRVFVTTTAAKSKKFDPIVKYRNLDFIGIAASPARVLPDWEFKDIGSLCYEVEIKEAFPYTDDWRTKKECPFEQIQLRAEAYYSDKGQDILVTGKKDILCMPPSANNGMENSTGNTVKETENADEYFNHFDDLNGWVLGEGFFSPRCGKPVGQEDSKIYVPQNSDVAAGYLELPKPIDIQDGKELTIEIRYRYNDLWGMYLGFSPTNDYICRADWYYDGVYFATMGGESRAPSQVGLFLSKDHQRIDAIRVDRPMDDNWHVAQLVRNSSKQEWSFYIDGEFLGSHPIVDNITSYRYLSFNAYGKGNLAEIDYVKVSQK